MKNFKIGQVTWQDQQNAEIKKNVQVLLSIEQKKKVWGGDIYTSLRTLARKVPSPWPLVFPLQEKKNAVFPSPLIIPSKLHMSSISLVTILYKPSTVLSYPCIFI